MSTATSIAVDERGSAAESRRGFGAELGLIAWQVFYEQRAFWRNRRRALASLAFPLMFLLIFGAIVHGHIKSRGNVSFINFYVPGIIAYTVMALGFSTMALSLAMLRDKGVIKRIRATPMPWASYLAGIVLSMVVTVIVATILLLVVGIAFYGASLRISALPGLVATIALGTACFTSLGIAASRLIPKPDSGTPILMFVTLPLSFISEVFFPLEEAETLRHIGAFFPLNPLANGLAPAFDPHMTGAGFAAHDLRSLAIWTVVGCVLMVRSMRVLSAKD
ncbi:MAG TPA: ABC transporter permease [Solirubrobacteraceae bacterium]|jgi:ABC-2 type transport system permease protein